MGSTSRYGRSYRIALVVGGACMAFGLVSLLAEAAATEPANFALFFLGLAIVHDLVLAPVVVMVGVVLRRALPRAGRGALVGCLVVSAIVVLFSIPFVARWGAQPDNPSFLPRNYSFGVAAVLAVVWAVTAAVVLGRSRGAR